MEKIDTDYKRRNLKSLAKLFKPFNRDWAPLTLLISYAILRSLIHSNQIFVWFQWFELSRLYLDISRPQINVFISFTHRLVDKLQKTLKQTRWFLESLRIPYGHENKLAKYDVTNTVYSFPISARPFLVRFRKALGNRRIFLSWAPRFVQNLIFRVDPASCWYNWCF